MKVREEDPQLYSQDVVWHALRVLLPPGPELEYRARTTGAFRRKRGVREAVDLLRVALSYGFCGLSFNATAAWATANESAQLCKKAVIKRVRGCAEFIEGIIADKLSARLPTLQLHGLRMRMVDATRVAYPGCRHATWRIHASFDPVSGQLCELFTTDHRGGERLSRFTVRPGELYVADRSYGTRPGIWHIFQNGGHFLLRSTWHHTPLEHPDGRPFDLFGALRSLADGEAGDFEVRIQPDERHGIEAVACRLVAIRKSKEAAEASKKRILKEAQKKKRTVGDETLEACEYLFVVTSLGRDEFGAEAILNLYRMRWQIEIEFKRLKSLMRLDDLRGRTAQTIRASLAAKLLGAILVEELAGIPSKAANHWTKLQVMYESVRQAVLGSDAAARWITQRAAQALIPAADRRSRLTQMQIAGCFSA
jgi:hypothetical protein